MLKIGLVKGFIKPTVHHKPLNQLLVCCLMKQPFSFSKILKWNCDFNWCFVIFAHFPRELNKFAYFVQVQVASCGLKSFWIPHVELWVRAFKAVNRILGSGAEDWVVTLE